MAFVPAAQAARILRAWGNKVDSDPVGLIAGGQGDAAWTMIVRFVKDGYIKDDDARDWNADDLLKSLRDGTEAANEDRRARGFPELDVVGWIAPPAYDAGTHRLVSSLAVREKATPDSQVQSVNYFTYALGRNGYFSFDLLSDRNKIASDQMAAAPALDGLGYDEGHRYSDFVASSDHVAAYGLAALVGVVAAKKLGLLALAGLFAMKFAKIGVVALAAAGGIFARVFRRKGRGQPSGPA